LFCDFTMRLPSFFDTDERPRKLGTLGDPHEVNGEFRDSETPGSSFISAVLAFAWRAIRI